MINIDDLKSDWKARQKTELPASKGRDAAAFINDFERVQRKTKKENIIVSILFLLTAIILWTMFYYMSNATWWTLSGLIIITAEMAGYIAFAWTRNSLKRRSSLQHNSYQYLESAIKKLKYRKFLMIYIVPIYAILLIAGLNMAYIDILQSMNLMWRWIIHSGITIILAGFFFFQIRSKLKKERKEIDPLIADLQSMKEDLNP